MATEIPIDTQEIFDRVVTHLASMTERSTSANGNCKYRGPNGAMCAIGCLIPNDRYKPNWDKKNYTARKLTRLIPEWKDKGDTFGFFLGRLQDAHDMTYTWDGDRAHMKERLASIAKEYGLSTEVIDKVEWK